MIPYSARLIYESLSSQHATTLFDALSSPEIYEHIMGDAPLTAASFSADILARIAGPPASQPDEQWFNVAIALRDTVAPRYIGRLEATSYYGTSAEVAYLLSPEFWRQGYAFEAMAWWHAHLRAAGVKELWACVTPTNTRSITLLQRLGYSVADLSQAPKLASYDAGDWVFHFVMRRGVM